MQIENYSIELSSYRFFEQQDRVSEEYREWGTGAGESSEQSLPEQKDRIMISEKAMRLAGKSFSSEVTEAQDKKDIEGVLDPKTMILKKMIEFLTGKEIDISEVSIDDPGQSGEDYRPAADLQEAASEVTEQGWGMSFTVTESHYEYEETGFSAQGVIRTADGQDISFTLNLQMSREYFSESSLEITAGELLIDPLVISFSGNAADLSDMRFSFDIDSDGEKNSINYLEPGSGFLAFDKDGDGEIDDGSELFGPSTGDGFQELAAYDSDNNNWIDENDPVYSRLSVWEKTAGSDNLKTLSEAGVGAIYLGNLSTGFDIKNEAGELYGQIQKTGVYLSDSGNTGAIQHIDLTG